MWPRLLVFALALGSALGQAAPGTPAYYQLQEFKNNANGSAILTTRWGAPLSKAQAYGTLNSDLVFSARFLEEVSAFSRERIPPRVVNAKGAGAFGEFVVTHDVTDITNVALFSEIGKVTPLVARFSSVLSERGSPDTIRTPYGLAIKFYTEEGNWDFTGFSADTFAIKDPLFFPSACHAAFRNVRTNIPDPSAFYDFLFSFPTSVSVLSQFLGDMGVPASYRHVPGYNIHTFQVENDKQEISFVRFAAIPKQGLKYLNDTVAKELSASRPDYYTEDLYNAIESGDHPKWIFGMQVIRECDIPSDFDIFDVTLRWDYARFPIRPIGVVTLNRNPRNYFADIEQAAFSPGHLVPGMQGIDTLWQGRTMQYHDAAIARLGVNYLKIPVNRPRYSATYLRDGAAPVGDNGGDGPNYFPNVYRGPQPTDTRTRTKRVKVYTDPAPTNLAQTTAYYLSLSEGAKRRLAQNIANTLIYAYPAVQKRGMKLFGSVHPRLGKDIKLWLIEAAKTVKSVTAPPPTIED